MQYSHYSAPSPARSDGIRLDMATTTSCRSGAAATPTAATPAIDPSSVGSKNNTSDSLTGSSHAAAAVQILGLTTAHTKVAVAETFRLEHVHCPGLPYKVFTDGSVRDEPEQGRPMLFGSRRRQGVSSVHRQQRHGSNQTFAQES